MVIKDASNTTPASLRRTHRGMVLSSIEGAPGISRAEIARDLGFSDMASTRIVRELLAAGLVEEFEGNGEKRPHKKRMGRPKTRLRIVPEGAFAAGITLSAYHSEVSICDAAGQLLASKTVEPLSFDDFKEVAILFADALQTLIAEIEIDTARIVGVGVSLSARTDPSRGEITLSEYFGWSADNGAFCTAVSNVIGLPVEIENIADALALAEMRFGAARDTSEFSLIHAATFVGSSVVSGGRVARGASGLSGQLGHVRSAATPLTCVCGRNDCLNLTATGFGLIAKSGRLDHGAFDTTKLSLYASSLIDLLSDNLSAEDVAEAGGNLAPALDTLGKLLAPKKVILSGYLGANDVYFEGAKSRLETEYEHGSTSDFELVKGTISADRSAALLALHAFYYSDRLDFERLADARPPVENAIA